MGYRDKGAARARQRSEQDGVMRTKVSTVPAVEKHRATAGHAPRSPRAANLEHATPEASTQAGAGVCQSAADVATWIESVPGIPPESARTYATAFLTHDIDSDTMDVMMADDLKDVVKSAIHRAKLISKWKKRKARFTSV